MRKLFGYLDNLVPEGYIRRLDIIESASVPLIKIIIDLQVIQEITRNKAAHRAQLEKDEAFVPEPFVLLDSCMASLHIDITFDDYNAS